ncbi:MAG: type IV pilus biogenesis protein PilM [Planctomycetota bacterium]
MEKQNCLGVYLSQEIATAVLLSAKGPNINVQDCFSVSADSAEEPGQSLASVVARKIAARSRSFNSVAVAVDCALFTQNELRSEFTSQKQIAQTIRFDAEEVLAGDSSELAIAFDVLAADQDGSDLAVFAANRVLLEDILADMEDGNIDPMSIEPDVVCLSRFFRHYLEPSEDANPILTIFSQQSCYIIINPSHSKNAPVVRSFLVNSSQDKTQVLARQIPLTTASLKLDRPVTSLLIAGRVENVDYDLLAERTGLEVQTIDLPLPAGADRSESAVQTADAGFAIAYGAALSEFIKTKKTDFREDFAPYMGKKIILQKSLRLISVALTVLLLAAGIHFQLQVFRKNSYTNRLDEKMRAEYSAVMLGRKPPPKEPIPYKLKREYGNILKKKKGLLGDDASVPAKLAIIFDALESAPKKIDLKIESISITPKSMRIIGDTNKRSATLSLFKTFKEKKFKVQQPNLAQKGNRDTFSIILELSQ